MHNPQDYKHIAAWGRFMGSYETYIKAQQELAASENAPLNSIYCNFGKDSKRWATADQIVNDAKRKYINEEANAI